MKKTTIIAAEDSTADAPAHLLTSITGVKIWHFPKAFIDAPKIMMPYFTGVVTFVDIMSEKEPFVASMELDNLFMYDIPSFTRTVWNQIRNVNILDILTLLNEYAQYFLPHTPPPHNSS